MPFSGYRDRLKQAMLNIAINALEAMPDGGELQLGLELQDGQARIAVRDNGPGIPPELLERMITRCTSPPKPAAPASGLYVARSVAEAHGGRSASKPICSRHLLPDILPL